MSPWRMPNDGCQSIVEDFGDFLNFKVVVARTERAHLVLLPFLRKLGDAFGNGARHAPALFDVIQIFRKTITRFDGPTGAAGEHVLHLARTEA